ncbi:unnamed protein product [Colias eurytheme]|nr:unnamed protein product [Colias eurytheme]
MSHNRCNSCRSPISDECFMECSKQYCKKTFDLKCLNIERDLFNAFTVDYRKKWVCSECVDCSNLSTFNSPTFVNTQRGNRLISSSPSSTDAMLLEHLLQLRSEIVSRLESQDTAIKYLQNQFNETKSSLRSILDIVRVLETKVSNNLVERTSSTASTGVCKSPSDNNKKIILSNSTDRQEVNFTGATNSRTEHYLNTVTEVTQGSICELKSPRNEELSEKDDWKTVQKKPKNKSNQKQLNNVRMGRNAECLTLKGMERKKYLHVWRLQPETTVEAVTTYVESICGSDAGIKTEKIIHKTQRDYASFIIGLPESLFNKLNQPEIWPMNAQFSEWTWFRKSTKKSATK